MKHLFKSILFAGLSLTLLASCSRQYAPTQKADPENPKYAPTRSKVTPSNTGDNTPGHQNRVIRAKNP